MFKVVTSLMSVWEEEWFVSKKYYDLILRINVAVCLMNKKQIGAHQLLQAKLQLWRNRPIIHNARIGNAQMNFYELFGCPTKWPKSIKRRLTLHINSHDSDLTVQCA